MPCTFCEVVARRATATIIREWPDAIAIVPLNPVTPGHALVIPRAHVPDFADDPAISATTMHRAAQLACDGGLYEPPYSANLITSRGAEATQTVSHLHLHVIPRREGDGLSLPWSRSA